MLSKSNGDKIRCKMRWEHVPSVRSVKDSCVLIMVCKRQRKQEKVLARRQLRIIKCVKAELMWKHRLVKAHCEVLLQVTITVILLLNICLFDKTRQKIKHLLSV